MLIHFFMVFLLCLHSTMISEMTVSGLPPCHFERSRMTV